MASLCQCVERVEVTPDISVTLRLAICDCGRRVFSVCTNAGVFIWHGIVIEALQMNPLPIHVLS